MLETVPRDEDRSEDKTGTEENVVMLLLYVGLYEAVWTFLLLITRIYTM